jgi:hypothetical protein
MDALLEGLVDRLRTSGRFADSMLLEIVHSAMLDAHKKTMSEEKWGLVRLHHNARFHELSIMELECCLKVVQKEAENNFSDQRYEFEQTLASLSEQQALMQKKFEELEIIIAEKDRELTRRHQNELKIKLPFEVVGNHEVEKAVKKYVENNSSCQSSRMHNVERYDHGLFDKLKSSIEQELLKIETKLQNERDTFTGNLQILKQDSTDGVIDLENDGINQLHGFYNAAHLLTGFEEMISDVSILKEDINFSFQMMESSKSLFKTTLEENQLQMDVECEMLNLFMRSFIQEAQCNKCRLDSIGVIRPADKTAKSQSTKGTPEEAVALREQIDKVVFSSMINEWINKINTIAIKHSLREDIDNLLFREVIRDMAKFSSSRMTAMPDKERDDVAVSSINDRIDNKQVFEIEYSLREDINRFALSEIMKDFINFSLSAQRTCCNTKNSDDEAQKKTINKGIFQENNTVFTKLSGNFLNVETMISSTTHANNKRFVHYGMKNQRNCFYN